MFAALVCVAPPYGAAGLNVPYSVRKNPNQAIAPIAGRAMNGNRFRRPSRVEINRNTRNTPSMAAMMANRVCSHGRSASAAPVASQRVRLKPDATDRGDANPELGSSNAMAAKITSVAPSPSGYTANDSKKNGTVNAQAAQANQAAPALSVNL